LQLPFEHVFPEAQTVLQLPQWLGSVFGFVQTAPHCVLPLGQTHVPLVQTSPLGQAVLQLPQWLGSVVRFTHPAAPQFA